MDMRFTAGDAVEVQVGGRSGKWMAARIERPAPYRGREGYYIFWNLPADAPSWESRGGWVQGSCVRAAVSAEPLWFYRWVPGRSMRIGAIIHNGKTLYGPVSVGR